MCTWTTCSSSAAHAPDVNCKVLASLLPGWVWVLPSLLVGCLAPSAGPSLEPGSCSCPLCMPAAQSPSSACVFHGLTFNPPVQVGEMTTAPVKTQFGHHLILCEGRKQKL